MKRKLESPMKNRAQKRWTAKEIECLLLMIELGIPRERIANALGRTEKAVQHKRDDLSIDHPFTFDREEEFELEPYSDPVPKFMKPRVKVVAQVSASIN